MDGEHIFSAAIVLVMANLAFPHNDRDHIAMEKALDVLRGMAEKGNGHIRARHELLIRLRGMTAAEPAASMPPVAGPTIAPPALALPAEIEGELPPEATMQPFDIDTALPGMQYTGDVNLWEEGYGDWGPAVDFDWGAWTEAAQGTGR